MTKPIPLKVTPEAAARVAELGMQTEFQRMLDHTFQAVPGLRAVDVTLEYDPATGDDPRVVIWARLTDRGLVYDPTAEQWGTWKVETFPPEVCQHFVLLAVFGAGHNGR
jgi:hypothetical protein